MKGSVLQSGWIRLSAKLLSGDTLAALPPGPPSAYSYLPIPSSSSSQAQSNNTVSRTAASSPGPRAQSPSTELTTPLTTPTSPISPLRAYLFGSPSSNLSNVNVQGANTLNSNTGAHNYVGYFLPSWIYQPAQARIQDNDKVVYGVLRTNGCLYLYEKDDMVRLVQVIDIFEFDASLWLPDDYIDGEIYLKDRPIVLKKKRSSDENWYLYASNASEKEDWYFPLRRAALWLETHKRGTLIVSNEGSAATLTPTEDVVKEIKFQFHPTNNFPGAMAKLKAKLEASQDSPTAWINALFGRIFVATHQTHESRQGTIRSLARKIARVRMPSFLSDLVIKDVDMGDEPPYFQNPKLVSIGTDGEVNIDVDFVYTGGFKLHISTVASLSVSSAFNPVEIPLELVVRIKRMEGRLLLRFKPFVESNRFWMGFYPTPKPTFECDVDPIVSDRLIKLSWLSQQIEAKFRDVLDEVFVLPNMDDMNFSDSKGTGGIYEDDYIYSPKKEEDVKENGKKENVEQRSNQVKEGRPPLPEEKQTTRQHSLSEIPLPAHNSQQTKTSQARHRTLSLPMVGESKLDISFPARKSSLEGDNDSPAISTQNMSAGPNSAPGSPIRSPRTLPPASLSNIMNAEVEKPQHITSVTMVRKRKKVDIHHPRHGHHHDQHLHQQQQQSQSNQHRH